MKRLFLALAFLILFILPSNVFARENVNYWYIKDFTSDIKINSDSSLLIDEKIVADCGFCFDKHGIYRILPTYYTPEKGKRVNLHLKLISITDFNSKAYKYETINDLVDKTVTWKIGDPNTEVQGENNYEIKYSVANGIRSENADFDEFYWNLNGNFWDIETDQFTANITFPEKIEKNNTKINLYSGEFGSKDAGGAKSIWIDDNILQVKSLKTLAVGEGITISVTFPKGIISAYQPTFFETYGQYFYFLIPILIFLLCFLLWRKYGNDPSVNPTVAPEFDIPEKLSPMSLGMVYTDGILKNQFISAAIINLAVKKAIKIEEIKTKSIFSSKNFKLIRFKGDVKNLTFDEKQLLENLLGGKDEVLLSSLQNKFYVHIPALSSAVKNDLVEKKYLMPYSRLGQILFIVAAVIFLILTFLAFVLSGYLAINLFLSSIIFAVFSFIMPKRPEEGAKFYFKVLGFKLFLNTAEKYRQRFLEKENLFENFLPYAMMFGMTKLWIEKMKKIYGEEYFAHYHPIWYIGSLSTFNENTFNSVISGVSSNMSSTISSRPSSSGSGGGGFSGGGGGGGGGGGW